MHTQTQLRDRLLELGIDRDVRTLTNWRQKGLLPPLQRTGAGRGCGARWFWDEDQLDQAIAIDYLLRRSGLVEETVFALWLSGYPVDTAAARRAWIQHLKRVQHQRWKAASRYSAGLHGLGHSWWKRLKSNKVFGLPWWRESLSSDSNLLPIFWETPRNGCSMRSTETMRHTEIRLRN